MTALEAAVQVLKEVGQPLKADELTRRILEQKLWECTGKTPTATVTAQLYMSIKKKGKDSPFVLVEPLIFGLRELGHLKIKTPDKKKGKEKYSFTDSAEKILEKFGNKQPMHYRDITNKALELDWLSTEGKTPESTMYAQLLTEVKRDKKRGVQSRFVFHGRGMVGLSQWMSKGLAYQIELHNKEVRKVLHKNLLAMDPTGFEELIANLLAEIGFEDIEVTKRTSDGGIDVRGTLVVGEVIRTRMAVQAKRWKLTNRVQSPLVQQVRGSLGTHEQGLIITTSDFSQGAKEEAARPDAVPVGLMNGEQLVALLAEYQIGVTRQSHDILDLSE